MAVDARHERVGVGAALAPLAAVVLAVVDGQRQMFWLIVTIVLLVAQVVWRGLVVRAAVRHAHSDRTSASDSLTGLINRDRFVALLDERTERPASVVAIFDIDGFREINQTLGRAGGDEVLSAVTERLVQATRDADVVARVGADQFAVLLAGIDDDALAVEIVGRLLVSFGNPLEVGGVDVELAASVGMAVATGISGLDAVQRATVALEAAKARSTTVEVFRPEHEAVERAALSVVAEVRQALDDDQFDPYFQPVVESASGRTIGFESLVRWNHPERGVIPPGLFLHQIEHLPVGRDFTDRLLDRSLQGLTALDAEHIGLSFNLSLRDAEDPNLPLVVASLLDRHGVDARRLTLEVPERLGARRRDRVQRVLRQLGDLGCGIALDDFGSTSVPIEFLASLPVTEIKIDARFTGAGRDGAQARRVVQHCVGLGHGAGLRVTAKGVEREAIFREVIELGCDAAQGYHFAWPMPVVEVGPWLANERVFVSSPVSEPVRTLER